MPENEPQHDPSNWKLGFIYYNPQDKRLFLPKRIAAMGITLNFANPFAYLLIGAVIAFLWFLSSLAKT